MAEFENQMEQQETSSSLLKTVGGLAVSFAAWGLYTKVGMGAMSMASKRLVTLLKDSPKVTGTLKVLRDTAVTKDITSVSELIRKSPLKSSDGLLGSFAEMSRYLDETSLEARKFSSRMSGGLRSTAMLKRFWSMPGSEKTDLLKSAGALYLKELAVTAPLFYVGEQAVGILNRDSIERQKEWHPDWWNLPGHAVNFAKWLPSFVAIDLPFRGITTAAPALRNIVSNKLNRSLEGTASGEFITDLLANANNLIKKSDTKLHAVGNAYRYAYNQTGGQSGHGLFLVKDNTKLFKYRVNKNPINTALERLYIFKKEWKAQSGSISNKFGVSTVHKQFLFDDRGTIDNAEFYELLRNTNADNKVGSELQEGLYRSVTVAPKRRLLTKALGLVPARLKHIKEVDAALYKQHITMLTGASKAYRNETITGDSQKAAFRYIWGLRPDEKLLNARRSRLDLLYKKDVYFDVKRRKLVDLSEVTPGAMMRRALHWATKPLSFGRRFDVPAIFQLNLLRSQAPDLIVSGDNQIIAGNALLPQYKESVPKFVKFESYQPKENRENALRGVGVYLRDQSKRGSTMYILRDNGSGIFEYKPITRSTLALLPAMHHSKLRNVMAQAHKLLIDPGFVPDTVREFGTGPLGKARKFLYEKLDLFGGDSLSDVSAIDLLKVYTGNASMKRLFNKNSNRFLQEYGFDIKKYTTKESTDKLLSYLETVDSAFYALNKQTSHVINRREVFNEFLKPLTAKTTSPDVDAELFAEIRKLGVDNILSNPKTANEAVGLILRQGSQYIDTTRGATEIRQLYKHLANASDNEFYNPVGEQISDKLVRFIANYRMSSAAGQGAVNELTIKDAGNTLAKRVVNVVNNVIGSTTNRRDRALTEMLFVSEKFRVGSQYMRVRDVVSPDSGNDPTEVFNGLLSVLKEADEAGTLERFSKEIGSFVKYSTPNRYREQMFREASMVAHRDPYIAVEKDPKTLLELGGYYIYDTFGTALDFIGLGWSRQKYSEFLPKLKDNKLNWDNSVLGLWGKRFAYASAAAFAYRSADTFFDVNPMFSGTALDEGITVAAADQLVNARLASAKVFDIAGITDMAQYMEGLMPKSTSILPGAVTGLFLGGLPGALVGGAINRYTQTQLDDTPLSSLAILPPLAPFVTDITKSYDELKDIYSGKESIPYRKGAGWSLGSTPIEGGRIQAWVPSWYTKLKSQYKSTDVLYGSKFEELIFKDLPFIDFSVGDIINPQYLTNKQAERRPYVVPDVPFSEVPLLGAILGPTIGRAYNLIHPFGKVSAMHEESATEALLGGVSDGQDNLWGYGGIYSGAPYLGLEGSDNQFSAAIPSAIGEYTHGEVASPFDTRQILSEMLYRQFTEPAGIIGFVGSNLLWGGDAPYSDQPAFAAASEMDSFTRSMWDSNLGDTFMLSEGFRRLFPRPRYNYEKVNPLSNKMPGWMPDKFKAGDPYCVTPDTYIEVAGSLKPASDVVPGDLIRTMHGRFYPVRRVAPRFVNEDIYVIKLKGIPWPIKVTSEHPFYINKQWIKAEELTHRDRILYPLLRIKVPSWVTLVEEDSRTTMINGVNITGKFSRLCGLLLKSVDLNSNALTLKGADAKEAVNLTKELLNVSPTARGHYGVQGIQNFVKSLINDGLPAAFFGVSMPIFLQFLIPFSRMDQHDNLWFDMPNEYLAYQAWSYMLQHAIPGRINGSSVYYTNVNATYLGQLCGYNPPVSHFSSEAEKDFITFGYDRNNSCYDFAQIKIESITTQHYEGFVYGFEVDSDDSFCVAGALTHNTKIPQGELLLPGEGYESVNDVKLTFPSGPSSLGKDAYTQALNMIGLRQDMDERSEEILEEGTRSHRIVQEMLTRYSDSVQSEALVVDPYENIKGYVDVLIRDMRGEHPVEIKTIGGEGFKKLFKPKYEHQVQLNLYSHILNSKSGTLLYVNRDDPTQIRSFNVKYDPALYQESINRLHEARSLAAKYLQQGYGTAAEGYSNLDRARVLLNADPFSQEFKDNMRVLDKQYELGILDVEEQAQYDKLQRQHNAMMWKQEMHPYRFKWSKIMSPDVEYENYSLNENIKAAAEYGAAERVAGSLWEKFTHLKSPLHTKLFGLYSPDEQYERNVLYGREFKLWNKPIDHWIEPYSRGLTSVTDPVQGAISFGLGGSLLGGPVLGSLTMPLGALYGFMHGAYRNITGTKYIPDKFEEESELAEYFDRAKYYNAHMLYLATRDQKYMRQMSETTQGWVLSAMADEGMRSESRKKHTPYVQGIGSDMGFGSPWQGIAKDISFNIGRSLYFKAQQSKSLSAKLSRLLGTAIQPITKVPIGADFRYTDAIFNTVGSRKYFVDKAEKTMDQIAASNKYKQMYNEIGALHYSDLRHMELVHASPYRIQNVIMPGKRDAWKTGGVYAASNPDAVRYGAHTHKVKGLFSINDVEYDVKNASTLGQHLKYDKNQDMFVTAGGGFIKAVNVNQLYHMPKGNKLARLSERMLSKYSKYVDDEERLYRIAVSRNKKVFKGDYFSTLNNIELSARYSELLSSIPGSKIMLDLQGRRVLKVKGHKYTIPVINDRDKVNPDWVPRGSRIALDPSAEINNASKFMTEFEQSTGHKIFIKGGAARAKYSGLDDSYVKDIDFLVIPQTGSSVEQALIDSKDYLIRNKTAADIGVEHSLQDFFRSTDLTINQVVVDKANNIIITNRAIKDYKNKVLRTTGYQQIVSDRDRQLYRVAKFKQKREFSGWTDKMRVRIHGTKTKEAYLSKVLRTSDDISKLESAGNLDRLSTYNTTVISAETGALSSAIRHFHNPAAKNLGPDKGFGSPWRGLLGVRRAAVSRSGAVGVSLGKRLMDYPEYLSYIDHNKDVKYAKDIIYAANIPQKVLNLIATKSQAISTRSIIMHERAHDMLTRVEHDLPYISFELHTALRKSPIKYYLRKQFLKSKGYDTDDITSVVSEAFAYTSEKYKQGSWYLNSNKEALSWLVNKTFPKLDNQLNDQLINSLMRASVLWKKNIVQNRIGYNAYVRLLENDIVRREKDISKMLAVRRSFSANTESTLSGKARFVNKIEQDPVVNTTIDEQLAQLENNAKRWIDIENAAKNKLASADDELWAYNWMNTKDINKDLYDRAVREVTRRKEEYFKTHGTTLKDDPLSRMIDNNFFTNKIDDTVDAVAGTAVSQIKAQEVNTQSAVLGTDVFPTWLTAMLAGSPVALTMLKGEESPISADSRHMHNPSAMGLGADKGFGSPWQGIDVAESLIQGQVNDKEVENEIENSMLGLSIKGLPAWDKPYLFPFAKTTDEEERANILKMVDPQMRAILETTWGDRNDIPKYAEDMKDYFHKYQHPSMASQLMHPATKMEDVQLKTIQAYGHDAHDFGLGWRQQEDRIRNSPFDIEPIDINGESEEPQLLDLDQDDIQELLQSAMSNFGLGNASVVVRNIPGGSNTINLNLKVSRDRSNVDYINELGLRD